MKSLSFDKEEIESMRVSAGSDTGLSEMRFNLIFSGTLLWGFVLNFIMVRLLTTPVTNILYSSARGNSLAGVMIGFLVGYFVLCLLGSRLLRAESPAVNFAGFNLIAIPVGVLLTAALTAYLDRPSIVQNALMLTMGITVIMMTVSMVFPQFFQGLGRILLVSLLAVLVVELIALFFFPSLFSITDYIVAAIMCLYIGYDWSRVQSCPRTAQCAIGIAASLYLDIVNLFIRILSILGKKKN